MNYRTPLYLYQEIPDTPNLRTPDPPFDPAICKLYGSVCYEKGNIRILATDELPILWSVFVGGRQEATTYEWKWIQGFLERSERSTKLMTVRQF